MKNIKKYVLLALAGLTFAACNKREIIPPPKPKVELKNHFIGNINNTDVELTENVNGFTGKSDVTMIVSPSAIDSAVYQSEFSSTQSLQSLKILHGSILFEAASSPKPSLAYFKSFYTNNTQPVFFNEGKNGIAIEYRDAAGKTWKTRHQNVNPMESAQYVYLEQKTDETGDYMLFRLNFSTIVYRDEYDAINDITTELALPIANATYTGWYKR